MINKEAVIAQLKKVDDPELGINIVDLGLVYEIKVAGKDVEIIMTLTFPGCPFGAIVNEEVNKAVNSVKGIGKVKLTITFDPPWDLTKVSPEAAAEIGIM